MSTSTRRSKVLKRAGAAVAVITLLSTGYYMWCQSRSKPPSTRNDDGSDPDSNTGSSRSTQQRPPSALTSALRNWSGKRRITVSMKDIVLWNPSPDPTNPNHAFRESALPFLHMLVSQSHNEVYLLMVVNSDEEEVQIVSLLESSGLFNSGLDSRRVLFCSTEEGKGHMIRHIEPLVHVDNCDVVIQKLVQHVGHVVRVRKRVSLKQHRSPSIHSRTSSASGIMASTPSSCDPSSHASVSRQGSSGNAGVSLSRTPTLSSLDFRESAHETPIKVETILDEDAAQLASFSNVEYVESLAECSLVSH
ncbi:hypothetical protein DFS34DRAFT_619458 [Phlyctochytrium arcticum]|nr:hypothetical protein DFS34DRAFT_619458 [Phlyctochytrium arcticum]